MEVKGMARPSAQGLGRYGKNTTSDTGATRALSNVKAVSHVTGILTGFCLYSNPFFPCKVFCFCGLGRYEGVWKERDFSMPTQRA